MRPSSFTRHRLKETQLHDLARITGTYSSERGQPPFDPVMMTALLLLLCCCGIYSSRRIAKACWERADFMKIVGLDAPN
jgi:transposase